MTLAEKIARYLPRPTRVERLRAALESGPPVGAEFELVRTLRAWRLARRSARLRRLQRRLSGNASA